MEVQSDGATSDEASCEMACGTAAVGSHTMLLFGSVAAPAAAADPEAELSEPSVDMDHVVGPRRGGGSLTEVKAPSVFRGPRGHKPPKTGRRRKEPSRGRGRRAPPTARRSLVGDGSAEHDSGDSDTALEMGSSGEQPAPVGSPPRCLPVAGGLSFGFTWARRFWVAARRLFGEAHVLDRLGTQCRLSTHFSGLGTAEAAAAVEIRRSGCWALPPLALPPAPGLALKPGPWEGAGRGGATQAYRRDCRLSAQRSLRSSWRPAPARCSEWIARSSPRRLAREWQDALACWR